MKRESFRSRIFGSIVGAVVVNGVFFVGGALLLVFFTYGIIGCIDYASVYENPVYADAVVTSHDEHEDSEGTSTYYACVSYEVDGVRYNDVRYQSEASQSNLYRIGTELTVELNPEDHGQPMKDVASPGMVIVVGVFLAGWIGNLVTGLCRSRTSRGAMGTVDRETVAKDMRIMICSRTMHLIWLQITAMLITLPQFFPMLFGTGYYVAAAVTGVFWLICLLRILRDMRKVRNGEYQIRLDKLVRKEADTDSDGDDTYHLVYSSGTEQWRKCVSKHVYDRAKQGSTAYVAYLDGAKKPIVYYDTEDGAQAL